MCCFFIAQFFKSFAWTGGDELVDENETAVVAFIATKLLDGENVVMWLLVGAEEVGELSPMTAGEKGICRHSR